MPVTWERLATLEAANSFNVSNAAADVAKTDDPWADMANAQSLTKAVITKYAK